MRPIVLASGSSARSALLKAAGVKFRVAKSQVDESVWKNRLMAEGTNPKAVALALAEAKAIDQPADPEALVIGADQTLQIGDRLFDKTETVEDVRERLMRLRGHAFELHSALAGARDQKVVWRYEETAQLRVRDFSDDFLDRYLERNGDALATSLAGFVLEGEGVQLFDQIDGDYFSILGLPLLPLLNWLRTAGGLVS